MLVNEATTPTPRALRESLVSGGTDSAADVRLVNKSQVQQVQRMTGIPLPLKKLNPTSRQNLIDVNTSFQGLNSARSR